jgi:hypothetical protein
VSNLILCPGHVFCNQHDSRSAGKGFLDRVSLIVQTAWKSLLQPYNRIELPRGTKCTNMYFTLFTGVQSYRCHWEYKPDFSFLPRWFYLWSRKEQDQPVQCCNLEGLQLHSLIWLASHMGSELHIITNDNAAPLPIQIYKSQHQLYIRMCQFIAESCTGMGSVLHYPLLTHMSRTKAGDGKFWEHDNWSGSFWPFMDLHFQYCDHNIPPLDPVPH